MAWTDLSGAFSFGSKLTSAQMQNLRDNVIAAAKYQTVFTNAVVIQGTGVGSYTTVLSFVFVCPEHNDDFSLHFRGFLKITTSGIGYCRLNIGALNSPGGNHNTTTYTLTDFGAMDISTLTPATVYTANIQMYNDTGGSTAEMRGGVIWLSN